MGKLSFAEAKYEEVLLLHWISKNTFENNTKIQTFVVRNSIKSQIRLYKENSNNNEQFNLLRGCTDIFPDLPVLIDRKKGRQSESVSQSVSQ